MLTKTTKCKSGCGAQTMAMAGYCRTCKSLRHHAWERVEREGLLVDMAGGSWWIWTARGDVLVTGRDTKGEAVTALARGEA